MLKVNPRKIKSALKERGWQLTVFVIAALFLLYLAGVRIGPRRYTLITGTQKYSLEVAQTETEQEKGLGERAGLPADHGMLFIFDKQTDHCFWMKDMRFNIDMVWADITKHVTGIEQNVSPATYPMSYCNLGKYVIELPAGTVAKNKLYLTKQLHF